MLKMVGNSGQLSLGKKYAGQYFEVEQQPDGAVLLRPMKIVPDAEAWVHEPAMRDQLRRADEWARRTPRAETKLDELMKSAAKRSGKRA
jgi:hypothetical protein